MTHDLMLQQLNALRIDLQNLSQETKTKFGKEIAYFRPIKVISFSYSLKKTITEVLIELYTIDRTLIRITGDESIMAMMSLFTHYSRYNSEAVSLVDYMDSQNIGLVPL